MLRNARDRSLAHERVEKAPMAEPPLPCTFAMINAMNQITDPCMGACMQPQGSVEADDEVSEAQRALHAWLCWALLYRS
jgi:hypothetical protein|tara:strand:- start:2 stop:238 length:237 start_codon:yes stop_codon:yes gene_type:complete